MAYCSDSDSDYYYYEVQSPAWDIIPRDEDGNELECYTVRWVNNLKPCECIALSSCCAEHDSQKQL